MASKQVSRPFSEATFIKLVGILPIDVIREYLYDEGVKTDKFEEFENKSKTGIMKELRKYDKELLMKILYEDLDIPLNELILVASDYSRYLEDEARLADEERHKELIEALKLNRQITGKGFLKSQVGKMSASRKRRGEEGKEAAYNPTQMREEMSKRRRGDIRSSLLRELDTILAKPEAKTLSDEMKNKIIKSSGFYMHPSICTSKFHVDQFEYPSEVTRAYPDLENFLRYFKSRQDDLSPEVCKVVYDELLSKLK